MSYKPSRGPFKPRERWVARTPGFGVRGLSAGKSSGPQSHGAALLAWGLNMLAELGRRLLMLFRRRQFYADLEEEMRLHRELRERDRSRREWRLKKRGMRRAGDLGTKSF